MSRWHGRYSDTQLRAAAEELGLRHPVRVCADPELSSERYGYYNAKALLGVDPHHRIVVRPGRTLAQTDDTIAHELVHAQQWERNPGSMLLLGLLYDSNDPEDYDADPAERDARRRGPALASRYSFARADKEDT